MEAGRFLVLVSGVADPSRGTPPRRPTRSAAHASPPVPDDALEKIATPYTKQPRPGNSLSLASFAGARIRGLGLSVRWMPRPKAEAAARGALRAGHTAVPSASSGARAMDSARLTQAVQPRHGFASR
ncbi:hypothetical protein JCM2811A_17490 [Methylorubrum rhodinum]